MKIINYTNFINENFQDPPEEYIKTALLKIKKKIEGLFEKVSGDGVDQEEPEELELQPEEGEDSGEEVMTFKKALEKGEEKSGKEGALTLSELGAKLESCEMSRYSAQYDSLTVKFSDQEGWYNIFLTIPLKDVVEDMQENEDGDYSDKDIKNCSIKFKKYNIDNELVGQLGPSNYKLSDIDEEFFVNLKIEVDEEYGDDEEFEIET
jgi:hypothetical protein